jgi:hypothetical protein
MPPSRKKHSESEDLYKINVLIRFSAQSLISVPDGGACRRREL